jgi:alpha-mannosidase
VPEAFDWAASHRSCRRRGLVITSDVTLAKGAQALTVKTTVDNCVCDHRLRLLLPTGLSTDAWWVDLPFDLTERRITLDPANVNDKELPVPEKNMLAIAALAEDKAGLAFVSAGGLHEAAALDDAQRTLAITLLRGFQRPVATDGQPGGQILGQHTFSYAIAPFSGLAGLASLLALRDRLATGVRAIQTDDGFGIERRAASLLSIEPPAVRLSACKPAADGRGLILRLYNPLPGDLTASVTTGLPIAGVCRADGNEEDGQALPFQRSAFEVYVPAKKIVSVRLKLKKLHLGGEDEPAR